MLIAHRGDKIRQPENTIAAFEAAHGLGACAIQTEIQFSSGGTPWCCGHESVRPPSGTGYRPFHQFDDGELGRLSLTAFSELVHWALRHRHLDWFVELGAGTLERLGEEAVTSVVTLMPEEREPFALLSRDCHSLRLARSLGCHRVALKIDRVAQGLSAEVVTLAPDYLLIRDNRVDCRELPPGPWQWVVYEINSPQEAVEWRDRGAHHILTGNLPLLMRSREASDVYGF